MNYPYGFTVNAAGKKQRPSSAALALVLGLALAFSGSAAMASNKPIPGIDIVVKRNPPKAGGIPATLPSDASGNFSLRLTEAGNYTISTDCRLQGGCLPHKLSAELKPGADGEPSIIAILIGLLLPAQKASAGGTSFNFTVGDRGVVLDGQFQDTAGVRVAAGDVNQDGRAEARPSASGGSTAIPSFKIAENESPRPTDRGIITGAGASGGPHASPKGGDGELPGKTAAPKKTSVGKLPSKADDPTVYGQPVIFTASGRITPISVDPTDATPGISDQGAAGNLSSYSAAPRPDGGGVKPGIAVACCFDIFVEMAIQGKPDGIGPGGVQVSSTKTDENGAFNFTKLPAGKYNLNIAGQPSKSVTIGTGGALNGKVVRGSDGNPVLLVIAGNIGIATKSPTPSGVGSTGFGSGSAGSGFPGGPGSTFPVIIPGIPTGPGAGSPGGAMGGAGMKR